MTTSPLGASETRSVRQRLLDSASELFYQQGVRAVGIDAILKHADVARMSLYHHFGSKEELVVAFLKREDEEWSAWFLGEVEKRGRTPQERLLVAFDALQDWFASADWRGCPFNNAAAEMGPTSPAVLDVVRIHKRRDRDLFIRLVREAGLREPDTIGQGLFLLVEGAITMGLSEDRHAAMRTARDAAVELLRGAGWKG